MRKVEGISPLSMPPYRTDGRASTLMIIQLRSDHSQLPKPGPALLCFLGEEGQLSQVPQLARGRGSSPALPSPRLVGSVLYSPQTSTCSQVASQTRDVHLAFAGTAMYPDMDRSRPHYVSRCNRGYLQQSVPHCSQVSKSDSFHSTQIRCFSFSSISPPVTSFC